MNSASHDDADRLSLQPGGGTAADNDIGQPVFSKGVVLNTDGTITVPAGVTTFSVTVPTTQDTTTEASETVPLMIDTVVASGTILDDDTPPGRQTDRGQGRGRAARVARRGPRHGA